MSATGLSPAGEADSLYGAPVIGPDETVASIGAALAGVVLTPARREWRLAAAGALALAATCAALRFVLPVPALGAGGAGWWIGLASGCLMICGLLLLAGVEWRCGIGRLAQTAALFGASLATLFPASVHPMSLAALLAASAGLWGAALLPDLALLRDRLAEGGPAGASSRRGRFYRLAACGFRGSAGQWRVWDGACRGLALLGILAAVAVLTDLAVATALRSDRHDTLLPVALLVEAVLSGAGLTAALAVALRRVQGLDGLVTGRHLDILGRLILALGLAALYCHVTECVAAFLYGGAAERTHLARRVLGDGAPAFWMLMLVGLLPSQLFWIGTVRRKATALGLIGALVAIGLGADHGLIARSAAPTGDAAFSEALLAAFGPAAAALCAIGVFALGLFLVFRLVPPVSIVETRQLALARNSGAASDAAGSGPEPQGGRLAATFRSEAGLSEAVRSLTVLDRPPRLDAFGPVPMPEAAEALHRVRWRLRWAALGGAGLGAAAYLAVRAAEGVRAFDGAGAAVLSWAVLAVPVLSAATAGGTLGLVVALCYALRREAGAAPSSALAGRFVLTVVPSADGFNPAALLRRLNGLPEGAGRPLAVDGIAAAGPRR